MKLPRILATARRFVDGVCALQDVTKLTDAINGWATRREEVVRGGFLRLLKDLGYEHASMLRWLNDQAIESDYLPPKWHARVDELEQQLAAEREAHEGTKQSLIDEHHWRMVNHDNCNRLGGELNYANEQLSAARADLEALTRWRKQSEEPCPDVNAFVRRRFIGEMRNDMADPRELNDGNEYMHTPESLAAWKAQEGGGNG